MVFHHANKPSNMLLSIGSLLTDNMKLALLYRGLL